MAGHKSDNVCDSNDRGSTVSVSHPLYAQVGAEKFEDSGLIDWDQV
jgi:hypothetical protein